MTRDLHRPDVWAPRASRVDLVLGEDRRPMSPAAREGWWTSEALPAGTRYGFSLDGGPTLPDPRSLHQPDGVHGASEIVELSPPRPWPGRSVRGGVLYELHVGTFTPEGTFDAAVARLDHLVALGVDAVEVMPVADFPGDRGWGYDGVGLYAVHRAYGGPAAFQRFIDACHGRGLAVVLDVVHNHLGPEGNYLSAYGPYFTDRHVTPWGDAVNLDGEGSAEVRDFLLQSCRQWLVDFGVDGLRLDAVHALADDSELHFLAELSQAVQQWEREVGRPLALVAESELNQVWMVSPVGSVANARGMHAQWADDVHHALHSFFTGETHGYYADFGPVETLSKALTNAFVRDGSHSVFLDRPWGGPVDPDSPHYDGHSFVVCLQNHDQVGNRATGDRIHHSIAPGQQAGAAALYLLSAFTPMLFMGEEWAASSPFPFFSHLGPELGPLVTAGRAREFEHMGGMTGTPDPQLPETRDSAVLRWDETTDDAHAAMLEWYQRLIRIRHEQPDVCEASLRSTTVDIIDEDTLVMRRGAVTVAATRAIDRDVVLDLADGEVLASWGGTHEAPGRSVLRGPGALVLRSA